MYTCTKHSSVQCFHSLRCKDGFFASGDTASSLCGGWQGSISSERLLTYHNVLVSHLSTINSVAFVTETYGPYHLIASSS